MTTLDRERPTAVAEASVARPRRRRWLRLAAAIVVVAVVASTLGYLVDDQVSEHEHFDRLHTSLGVTRHRAAEAARELAQLRHDVALLTSQVGSDTTAWNQDTASLKAAYSALVITQADVSQQSSRIGALHTCLTGVQQALNALAVDNQAGAVSALSSVRSSCAAASGG